MQYRGTSLIRNRRRPQDFHRDLDIVLLQGPKGARFLMSEVPLYRRVIRNAPVLLCEVRAGSQAGMERCGHSVDHEGVVAP